MKTCANAPTIAESTTDFLSRQVEEAKRALDDQDAKLAAFKKQYMGQLPSDVDNNMRMLMSLNSQLDATTQTLSRAQQDKAYTESMLAQQIAAWKSSQSSTNPQTLEPAIEPTAGAIAELAGALYRRSPRRDQDQGRHRRGARRN